MDLNKLREDVNRLRLENKLLARNLHIERYVSKHELQRTLSDLRGENFRLQRDNEVGKNRVIGLTKEAESRENVVRVKRQEIKEIVDELEKQMAENGDMTLLIEALGEDNHSRSMDNLETSESNSVLTNQIQQMILEHDRLNKEMEKLNEDVNSGYKEIADLQSKFDISRNELQSSQAAIADTIKLQKSLEQDISQFNDDIVKAEADTKHLKAKKDHLEEEYELWRKRCESDDDKYSVLLTVMQDPAQVSQCVQTESFTKNNASENSGGKISKKQDYDRGTIVRVIGLGENAKKKFGKDLEVRATSYARHVNLNVKLNK